MTLIGVILTVIGGLALILSGWTISLKRTVEGQQTKCITMQTSWLGLITLEREKMSAVQAARIIKNNHDRSSEERTYRVELDTPNGIIPLSLWYSPDFDTKQETVNRINAFIGNPAAQSVLIKEGSLPGIVFSCVAFFSGITLLLFVA